MKALITGIAGFAGSHLAEYLLKAKKIEVFGIEKASRSVTNIAPFIDRIKLKECDLLDYESLEIILRDISPDLVFHLAALTYVPKSWQSPQETLKTNMIGSVNILEALRNSGLNPRFLMVGSSEEYGMVFENEIPIKEECPLRPLSPYGVSKVGQDLLGYQYYKSYDMNVVRVRPFNHTGPRRGEEFVVSNFAKQIASIEAGIEQPILHVGNLQAIRDFSDVRDVVKAYVLALEKGELGEVYNICSGTGYKIGRVVEMLLSKTDVKIEIREDPGRMRPSDVPMLVGCPDKFKVKTGWTSERDFEKTLEDTLNYWRERVKR